MSIKNYLTKLALLPMLVAAITTMSCDKVIYDNDDCTIHCQIKFKYDMNMKFADAFANSVSHVALYVYDANTGKLVHKQVESGEALSQEGYAMEFDNLTPGTYDMVAWCGDGLQEGNFDVPQTTIGTSKMEDLTCTMDREQGGKVTKDVKQLFHGMKRVTIKERYGVYTETIALTKNTNTVRVILQHLSGIDVNKDQFRFEITDDNGSMDYDNSMLPDEILAYNPWSVVAGSAGIGGSELASTRAQTSVSVALAEFTVCRLMTDKNPILSVYNVADNDKLVLSIPLKDYALLVKGNYNKNMADQEYLDRQDEYNLTFFLDEFGNWASSMIIINSWSVVLNDTEL